jgi:dienelactone hydrolase
VARRFAKVGYVGLAADLLSRTGGTAQFADESETTTAISELDQGGVISDMQSSVTWLQQQPYVQEGRIGAIGWCWGGGQAWRLATTDPRLNAVVSFYGINPPLENVPNIQAAVLGIYGEEDSRITDQEPELEEALADADKTYEMTVFEVPTTPFSTTRANGSIRRPQKKRGPRPWTGLTSTCSEDGIYLPTGACLRSIHRCKATASNGLQRAFERILPERLVTDHPEDRRARDLARRIGSRRTAKRCRRSCGSRTPKKREEAHR